MTNKAKFISELEVTSHIVNDENGHNQLVIRKPTLNRKIVQNIHQEEEYIEHIDKIIQRDFFPDLVDLRTTSEYLEAVENNDNEKMINLERQILNRPGKDGLLRHVSSSSANTPANFDSSNEPDYQDPMPSKKKSEPLHNPTKAEASDLGLDSYLATNTSEDNASFYQLLEDAEKKRREKMSWCYDKAAEMSSKSVYQLESLNEKPLAIMPKSASEPIELNSTDNNSTNLDVNDANDDDINVESTKQLSLIEKDAVVDSKSLLASYLESRPSVPKPDHVQTWAGYKVHNSVMFPPEGSPLTSEELIDMAAKQRTIIHENTRFKRPIATIQETLAKQKMASMNSANSAKLLGRFGPDGKEIRPESTPRMGGFSFVSHTPSPRPGAGNETPGMTWGEIESTPFRISTGDTPRIGDSLRIGDNLPSFKMAEISDREKIGLELTDKLRKEKRQKKDKAVNEIKSHLISPSSRLLTLSPAAQRLLSTKLQRVSTSIDMGLRASYTPSPLRRPSSNVHKRTTPRVNKRSRDTPASCRSVTPVGTPVVKSITDNLLNL